MTIFLLILATMFVAYSNGSNDNFKGVATLFACGTCRYRNALGWATLATFTGSLLSLYVAGRLMSHFSGHGLVAESVAGAPDFLAAVGLGAATTIILASLAGLPISTTHSLIGGLVGAGCIASDGAVAWSRLGTVFLLPLLVSPLLAMGLSMGLYGLLHRVRLRMGIVHDVCLCSCPAIDGAIGASRPPGTAALLATPPVRLRVGSLHTCSAPYTSIIMGISMQRILDVTHFFSAGLVSLARGLNDTPKIVALLVTVHALNPTRSMVLVAVAMALGGLLNARKVAQTLSHQITAMNHGQGLAANLTTAVLVLCASPLGLPVSTTHVSTGALFGIGAITGAANRATIRTIVVSWMLTLPAAAVASAILYRLFHL